MWDKEGIIYADVDSSDVPAAFIHWRTIPKPRDLPSDFMTSRSQFMMPQPAATFFDSRHSPMSRKPDAGGKT